MNGMQKFMASVMAQPVTEDIRARHEVRPFATEESSDSDDLLSVYATAAEVEAVRAAYWRIADAESAERRVVETLRRINGQIAEAHRHQGVDVHRAAAVALGEPVAPRPTTEPGPTLPDLQAQGTGLQARAEAAREHIKDCKGKFRAGALDLIRTCALRCMNDYADLTRRQAWCHHQIGLAQHLMGGALPVVDLVTWIKYAVPGSPHIPEVRRRCREEYGHPLLASGDWLNAPTTTALDKLRERAEKLFGAWPWR